MPNTKKKIWFTVLSSGLAVAIFTFIANKAWEIYRHHSLGPKYVSTAIRCENDSFFLYVRNNSDEPLDLIKAKIKIEAPELLKIETLGSYPDISKVYSVTATSGSAKLELLGNHLEISLKITQAISPKAVDHFGIKLQGLTEPVNLTNAKISAEIEDIKGNKYLTKR